MKRYILFIIALFTIVRTAVAQAEPDYLYFIPEEDATIFLHNNVLYSGMPITPNIQYSFDKNKWNTMSFEKKISETITVKKDCPVFFKGYNPGGISNKVSYVGFIVRNKDHFVRFACGGNIMTLIDGTGNTNVIPNEGCFRALFNSSYITTAPKLPATSLKEACYMWMFVDCRQLTSAPALPATTLADNCYEIMFNGCTSLTTAPELPATTLADNCYEGMFCGCKNLTTAPELPATTLADNCYGDMFAVCTSLTTAPSLPATTLADNCYKDMFRGCTNLVSAPELPATVLASYCYADMFSGCTKINKVTVGFTDWGVSSETSSWLKDVSETGFLFHPVGLIPRYGISYIPEGWVAIPIDKIDEVYTITVEDEYITITDNKKTAMYYDEIRFSVQDRSNDNYRLDKVLINDTEVSVENYKGTIKMSDFLEDIYIRTIYSKVYSITTDAYSSTDKTEASEGETVNVTFNRAGYNLTSATYNGTALTISNDAAQFTMPAENVTIATTYSLIEYNITADEFVTVDKTKATLHDQVSFTVADRTDDGYQLDKVLVNNTEVLGRSFNMADYLNDVTITAQYSRIAYSITTDEYSSTLSPTSYATYYVYVTFTKRLGYKITSATYNGTPLNIYGYTGSFVMPAANVTIASNYTPINYTITTDKNINPDKSTATINDQVTFTVVDRTFEGLTLEKVLLNDEEFTGTSFDMKDYLQDVKIKAVYSKIDYSITTDTYSSTNKTTANVGDIVNITFKHRDNYNLTSATYNGTALTITNNVAQFTMPAANVTIATTYTPIEFNVTAGEFVTVDKTKATINDKVTFTVADRTNNGYKLEKVLVNTTEVEITNYTGIIDMKDYLTDITITAHYSKTNYFIITDEYSSVDKNTANAGDKINVTFSKIPGYSISKAVFNDNELIIEDYASWFTMPAEKAYVAASYLPIIYTVTTDEYVTADKTNATINDQVSFTVADRTNDGYTLDKVLVNNIEFSGRSFNMADYLKNVSISAVYKNNNLVVEYTITNDEFSTTDKTQYAYGENVTVTFSKRDGYNLVSATINNTALNLNGYSATFKMPSNDVSIVAEYKKIENPVEYIITNTSEYVSVSTPTAKPGDEVSVFVSRRDGYTPHLFVNGAEVIINGNVAKYIQPSASVVITVDYKKDATTAVAEVSDNNPAVSVYPNPARQGEKLVISIDGGIDLRNAKILIYNTHGVLVKRIDHAAEYNETNLKSGVYNGVLIYKNGRQTFRIAVY